MVPLALYDYGLAYVMKPSEIIPLHNSSAGRKQS